MTPTEKGKFCLNIMKEEGIKNNERLANRINVRHFQTQRWMDDFNFRKSFRGTKMEKADHSIIRATVGMENKDREKITKFAIDKKKYAGEIEELVPVYKKADNQTKKELLKGNITIEEARFFMFRKRQ